MSFVPPPKGGTSGDDEYGLDVAKKKLSDVIGRPFDVDQILAGDRARHEREEKVKKEAMQKLDHELDKARQRRSEMRAKKAESYNETLIEKQDRFAAEKRRFAEELKQRRTHGTPSAPSQRKEKKPE